jgi:serine/threonine protein kinase
MQGGKIEEHVLKKWLCQLLLALDYLQMQKVLHRDVKTSNLLLTSDDDVQLGDFGLATLMDTVDGACCAGCLWGFVMLPWLAGRLHSSNSKQRK